MADNNTILEKLEGLVARFEEVSTLITDPAVIADQKRYVKLTKEYKELGDLMEARKEYIQVLNGIEEAKEIISNEADPEMREMAREELDACQARQPELEEHIKLLLVPADPQDSKNAILEIRGGTGGDEAAIFAGDLFRMYTKYCETKGWKMEISSVNEGAAGGFKEVICSVTGDNVYGTLKYESGVHRVQRVPATETQGRVFGTNIDFIHLEIQKTFRLNIPLFDFFRFRLQIGKLRSHYVRRPYTFQRHFAKFLDVH